MVTVKKMANKTEEELSKTFDKQEFKSAFKESATICLMYIVRFWFTLIGTEFKKDLSEQNLVTKPLLFT